MKRPEKNAYDMKTIEKAMLKGRQMRSEAFLAIFRNVKDR